MIGEDIKFVMLVIKASRVKGRAEDGERNKAGCLFWYGMVC
jgi:hypothetical protein